MCMYFNHIFIIVPFLVFYSHHVHDFFHVFFHFHAPYVLGVPLPLLAPKCNYNNNNNESNNMDEDNNNNNCSEDNNNDDNDDNNYDEI
jgi:hypothetical protein